MANLAAALKTLPAEIRKRVLVVFVTTDPARDTPERLGSWLAQFDSSFVGGQRRFGVDRDRAAQPGDARCGPRR
jgi:protein SCO1/2